MLGLIQFLEEIERSNQTVTLPAGEVERLVDRFGARVRSIGIWNKTTDGSVEIPIGNITEAVKVLDNQSLTEAVAQLRSPEEFAGVLSESSAASRLIEALCEIQEREFLLKVQQYQESTEPAETKRLREELARQLFG